MLELTLKQAPTVPLEAEVISPDVLCDRNIEEIRKLRLFHGKRRVPLGDFFDVAGEPSDWVKVRGDLSKVRWLGHRMQHGMLEIEGDVGMHLGAYMHGGHIRVHGNAGDWVGAEMRGGLIEVDGDAGGQVGAAYRGSRIGMNRGTIVIRGNAGLEVGMRMRRGLIALGGSARDFAGLEMKGGTIVLGGGADIRVGAWMRRGTIISLQQVELMPTFRPSGVFNPTFINLLARQLHPLGVELPYLESAGSYHRFAGDVAVNGKGELLVWQPCAA